MALVKGAIQQGVEQSMWTIAKRTLIGLGVMIGVVLATWLYAHRAEVQAAFKDGVCKSNGDPGCLGSDLLKRFYSKDGAAGSPRE